MKFIKWNPVEWLHSTCRDELTPAERATFHDYVCLASLPGLPPGKFKFSSEESLARQLNTPLDVILSTNKKCQKTNRISLTSDQEGLICSIIKWEHYQTYTDVTEHPVNRKNESNLQNVNKMEVQIRKDKIRIRKDKDSQETSTKDTRKLEINTIEKNLLVATPIELQLAEFLLEKILEKKPDFKRPNLQSWAKEADRMLRLDKRKPRRVKEVIVACQKDPFWSRNILSMRKLREKFDQLEMKLLPVEEEPFEQKFQRLIERKQKYGGSI